MRIALAVAGARGGRRSAARGRTRSPRSSTPSPRWAGSPRAAAGPRAAPARRPRTRTVQAEAPASTRPTGTVAARAEGNPFFAPGAGPRRGRPRRWRCRPPSRRPPARFLRLPVGGRRPARRRGGGRVPRLGGRPRRRHRGCPAERVLESSTPRAARCRSRRGDGRVTPGARPRSARRSPGRRRAPGSVHAAPRGSPTGWPPGTGPGRTRRPASRRTTRPPGSWTAARAALTWLERAADHALALSALDQFRELANRCWRCCPAPPSTRTPTAGGSCGRAAGSRFVDAWYGGMDSPTVREFCRQVRAWEVPRPPRAEDVELLSAGHRVLRAAGPPRRRRRAARAHGLAGRRRLGGPTATYLRFDMAGVVRWMQGRFDEALAPRPGRAGGRGRRRPRRSLAFPPPASRSSGPTAVGTWRPDHRLGAGGDGPRRRGRGRFRRRRVRPPVGAGPRDDGGDARRVRQLLDRPLSEPAWDGSATPRRSSGSPAAGRTPGPAGARRG